MLINVNKFDYSVLDDINPLNMRGGRKDKKKYYDVVTAFDIETTRLKDIEQSFMYIWQFQILDYTVYGRYWSEFIEFFENLKAKLNEDNRYIVVYVHNLSYEFQFLRGIYDFKTDEVFAIESRKIAKCYMWNKFEFRCSYIHSNMSLSEFTNKMKVENKKLDGTKFDYSKIRYPWTKLSKYELEYCTNDVLGLKQAIENEMKNDGDNLITIPLTATGYLRRDVKRIMRQKVSWSLMKEIQPDLEVYTLLNQAFRGGDTHANRFYSGQILENVKSFDRSSSYPDVMINCKFPMSKFEKYENPSDCLRDIGKKAILMDITLTNVDMKKWWCGYPYIAKAKCLYVENAMIDNGRILRADTVRLVITDVDWEIIYTDYRFENIIINNAYHAMYRELPKPFTGFIKYLYEQKTELKNVDGREHDYFRSKQKINSAYGLSAQDPLKDSIKFVDGDFITESKKNEDELIKAQRMSYRSYAWGVWVTAWARYRLHQAMWIVGEDFIYSDTDSVKYIGNHDEGFAKLNKLLEKDSRSTQAYAVDPKGVTHYMGVYENDGEYKKFITLGAKKYAYVDDKGLHVTISGVNKKKGGEELGNIENFKTGFTFVKAGGTEIVYNDENYGVYTVDKTHKLNITSNAVIRESTYTLGITDEYEKLLKNPNIFMYNINDR